MNCCKKSLHFKEDVKRKTLRTMTTENNDEHGNGSFLPPFHGVHRCRTGVVFACKSSMITIA